MLCHVLYPFLASDWIKHMTKHDVLAQRKAAWKPRTPKVTTGYLARYAAMVTSGNRGAILEVPKADK
jgi:dihydroxy-acid dehydratase